MAILQTVESSGALIVSFRHGKILSDVEIQAIGEELNQAVDAATNKRLLLDFARVEFMSSSMIGKLIVAKKRCDAADVALKLCNVSTNIADVFKITGLTKMFDIYKDQEKALSAFEKKGWFGK